MMHDQINNKSTSNYRPRNSCLIRGVITFKHIFIKVTFNSSVPTSKKTHCSSNTKTERLVFLRDTIDIFSDNHDKHIPDKFGKKNVQCVNVKECGIFTAVTAVLGKV